MDWSIVGGVVDEKEEEEVEVMEVMGMGLIEYIERERYIPHGILQRIIYIMQ